MKFFDRPESMRTMTVEETDDYTLNVRNGDGQVLFSLYNEGNGPIQIKLFVDTKLLSYDGCADGRGAEFRIGY